MGRKRGGATGFLGPWFETRDRKSGRAPHHEDTFVAVVRRTDLTYTIIVGPDRT